MIVAATTCLVTSLVAAEPAVAAFPGHDGRIAFGSNRGGNFEIYTVRPDGDGLHQLTRNGAFNACAAWSPDGRRVAFCSNMSGTFQIYLMRADGTDLHHVPTDVGSALFPRWSPNGRRLLFTGAANPGDPGDVYVINTDGTGEHNLTDDSADDAPQGASWQPSGGRIAYDSNVNGKYDVYTERPDGSDVRQVTNGAGDNQSPDWSPDGAALAFIHGGVDSAGNPIGEVYTVDVNGGHVRRVTQNSATDDRNPAWSPDGRQIVFRRSRSDGSTGLLRVDLATRAVHSIDSVGSDLGPSWQPVVCGEPARCSTAAV